MSALNLYYNLKPVVPRPVQRIARQIRAKIKLNQCAEKWPVCNSVVHRPAWFKEWPGNKKFALVVTHDVENTGGLNKIPDLARINMSYNIKSSFNIVPNRYFVPADYRKWLKRNHFEVGIHDLNHDGKLYGSFSGFQSLAKEINNYLDEWQACGFRSGAMHHNLEWISELNIEYDASTFDYDPFEPMPDGVDTIFPFWYSPKGGKKGFVELPYTIPQDYTLFNILKEKTNAVWKKKLDWIAQNGGMALFIVHPDYIHMNPDEKFDRDKYPCEYYTDFLDYIQKKYTGQFWNPLPCEMARFVKENVKK